MRGNAAPPLTQRVLFSAASRLRRILQLGIQPGSGVSPVSLSCCQRYAYDFCDLRHCKSCKEAELHQLRLGGLCLGQLVEALIEGQQILATHFRLGSRDVSDNAAVVTSVLGSLLAARVVDENAAHRLGRRRKEMSAVIPMLVATCAH